MATVEQALAECGQAAVWAWPQQKLLDNLDRLQRIATQVAALQLALIREVDGRAIATAQGATGTAAWLHDRHRISPGTATAQVKLAAEFSVPAAPVNFGYFG